MKLPINAEEAQKAYAQATPSMHGLGDKDVYDESYRLAREFLAKDVKLDQRISKLFTDPISPVLTSVARIACPSTSSQVRSEFYKLNIYAQGGFFKAHRDAPKAENHMGSLVVSLPCAFSGGELVVSMDGVETELKWDGQAGNALPWCFFFADLEHYVKPVTGGYRVTLSFYIFLDETSGDNKGRQSHA
jgi:hypothetical protein